MRILHVIRSDGWAGVERHVAELSRAQVALGDHVAVIGGDSALMAAAVGPEVRVTAAARLAGVVVAITTQPGPFDIIHTHMTAAEVGTAVAPRHRSVPVVSTRHFAAARGSGGVARPLVRLTARRVAAQIAVSRYVADHVDGPCTVVWSGVSPEPDGALALARERTVLVAQRLENEKRTDLALHAFACSRLAETGWRLRIAGDGSLRSELERLARSLRIAPAVDFLGHRSDVHALMSSAGIFLAPCPGEAFGLSVVEGMARRLPVVASGSGAHLETVGSVPGAATFVAGDATGAARLLVDLAGDEKHRDSYGALLQQRQRRSFTVDQQARNTNAVYRSVL